MKETGETVTAQSVIFRTVHTCLDGKATTVQTFAISTPRPIDLSLLTVSGRVETLPSEQTAQDKGNHEHQAQLEL